MGFSSLKDVTHVMFDGVNIADGIDTLGMKVSADVSVHHACGQVWDYNFWLGSYKGELTLSGWMDTLTTTPPLAQEDLGRVNALSTADKVVTVFLEGNAVSNRCWSFQAANVSEIEVGISNDDVHKLTPGITSRGAVDPSYVTTPYATRTAAGNTDTAYADMGALSSAGARAYLQVGAIVLGAAASATVVVRHSSDHITFVAHGDGSFADTTAISGQCITLSGLVNRYISTSWIYNGGAGTSISYLTTIAPLSTI